MTVTLDTNTEIRGEGREHVATTGAAQNVSRRRRGRT